MMILRVRVVRLGGGGRAVRGYSLVELNGGRSYTRNPSRLVLNRLTYLQT